MALSSHSDLAQLPCQLTQLLRQKISQLSDDLRAEKRVLSQAAQFLTHMRNLTHRGPNAGTPCRKYATVDGQGRPLDQRAQTLNNLYEAQ